MAQVQKSLATLRVMGDDVVPDKITELLGCAPTDSHTKGQIVRGSKTGREYIKKSGMWQLEAGDCEPENLDKQVAELLSKLTQDLNVWQLLSEQFTIDLFCGLFMEKTYEGLSISQDTLLALGQRRITLEIDIYGPTQELRDDDPCPCESGKTYAECCKPPAK
jgi:hypothetical protein